MKIELKMLNPLVEIKIDGTPDDLNKILHGVADYLYCVKRQGDDIENRKPNFDLFTSSKEYKDPTDPLMDEGAPLSFTGSVDARGDIDSVEFKGEDVHGEGGLFIPINDFGGEGC